MADILTRTYTYTGKSSWTAGESAVKLSSFAVTGDKRPITQILSISASWYRLHDTSSTVVHAAELVFSGGTTLKSNGVSKRGKGDVFKIESSFMDIPGAAAWEESDITLRTTLSTKLKYVSWLATSSQPMVLTITYLSSEFKPYITGAKLFRSSKINNIYAAADDGTSINFQATLAVEKTGKDGKYYREYIDAQIQICKLYGVEVIDAQANALSDGRKNRDTIIDTVHFTDLGAHIFGRYGNHRQAEDAQRRDSGGGGTYAGGRAEAGRKGQQRFFLQQQEEKQRRNRRRYRGGWFERLCAESPCQFPAASRQGRESDAGS